MNKPYIIVHMMASLDGRIDCDMTAQLRGDKEYYSSLEALAAPTRVTGSGTASLELADGQVNDQHADKLGKEAFKQNKAADSYNIIADSKGRLQWGDDAQADFPHLILTSENVTQSYLDYLDKQHISWIATGKNHVDLKRAMEILADQFHIKRLAVVGGGKINGGFLQAGLVDEISVVIGPGIDGRIGQPALFDGLTQNAPIALKQLKSVQSYDDGAIWLRYLV